MARHVDIAGRLFFFFGPCTKYAHLTFPFLVSRSWAVWFYILVTLPRNWPIMYGAVLHPVVFNHTWKYLHKPLLEEASALHLHK